MPLLLRGKLDRVDTVSGGVRVVDYKTGKPRRRDEMMGNTKGGDGGYYRQLAFYRILLARAESPRTMAEGVIEFVEPDDAGKVRTEAFDLPDADVRDLEALITKSAGEILTLSFWNDRCDAEDCEWCAMRFAGV
jgi:hypothetical protein